MNRSSKIIPVAITMILVAVAIAALVSLSRAIFFSSDSNQVSETDVAKEALLNSSKGRAVKMSVRGEIVADENFKSYEIIVSSSARKFDLYSGYEQKRKIESISLKNNVSGYDQFIYALERAGLADGKELPAEQNDLRGICANEDVYTFELIEKNQVINTYWTTTCNQINGSLGGSLKTIRGLFVDQIPGIDSTLRTNRLYSL